MKRTWSRAVLVTGALLAAAGSLACEPPPPVTGPVVATPDASPAPSTPDATPDPAPEPPTPRPQPALEIARHEQARTLGGSSGLLAFADDESPKVRAMAARGMGRIGDATALDLLARLGGDDDPDVRAEAAVAIGLIAADNADDENTVSRCRLLLTSAWDRETDLATDQTPLRPRRMVVWALRKVGGAKAVSLADILGAAMLDDSPALRAEALLTWAMLSRFARDTPDLDKPALLDAVQKNARGTAPEPRYAAIYAMLRRPLPVFVTPLTEAVNDAPNATERALAVRALTANKTFPTEVMERLLLGRDTPPLPADPDVQVRVEAVRNLGAQATPEAMALLDRLIDHLLAPFIAEGKGLDSADFHVLLAAVETAAAAPKPSRGLYRVLNAVRENPRFDRSTAAWGELLNAALLDCAAATGIDKLRRRLDRVSSCGLGVEAQFPAWRRTAAEADLIAALPSPALDRAAALDALFDKADSPQASAAVLYAAVTLLPEAPPAPDARPDPKLPALQQRLDALGRKALTRPDTVTQAIGLSLIAKARQPAAVETLRKTLDANSPLEPPGERLDLVFEALDGLATAKDAESTERIARYLGSPVPVVRARAAAALEKLGVTDTQTQLSPELPELGADQVAPERFQISLETTRGTIRVELWPDVAPVVAHAFRRLVERGFYDRLDFHRVIPDFVAQGGDPRGDGNGGPGYTLPAEWSAMPFERGVLGMAHAGKDTAGSQFFITHSPQPHLDGGYTVFGKVIEGMDVVDKLQVGDKLTHATIAVPAAP